MEIDGVGGKLGLLARGWQGGVVHTLVPGKDSVPVFDCIKILPSGTDTYYLVVICVDVEVSLGSGSIIPPFSRSQHEPSRGVYPGAQQLQWGCLVRCVESSRPRGVS